MLPIEDNNNNKQKKFNNHLSKNGFVEQYRNYTEQSSNNNYAVFFSNVKTMYKKYVEENNWSEQKFETVLVAIAEDYPTRNTPLSYVLMNMYGKKYEAGELFKTVEKKKEYLQYYIDEEELDNYLESDWINEW